MPKSLFIHIKSTDMKFPELELTAHTGEIVAPARAPKAVVYFFPKAFTTGCTRETIRFNELYDKFREKGYEVFGVSTDSVETLKKFAEKYGVRFKLLSDKGGRLASQLGILRPTGTAERVTYILNGGEVVHVLRGLKSADEHADRALELAK
ncbi:antioxidant protein, putative [Pyrobaculum ferrireducens]|uniref:thioredoxin-dependent peroxiredoxin n=2 Tax=Pyrobaculum ferrireducens TaxID=1104324 RepID=G7VC39_9CREN|nr:antioxidant protein, putative [Pyrobaculum ferrireducens]